MKKFLITTGIILVAALATKDTIERFRELDNISAGTPAQIEMRQPAQQQTGQSQSDSQTRNRRRYENNSLFNNNDRINNGNTLDNYNRTRGREYNSIRKDYNQK